MGDGEFSAMDAGCSPPWSQDGSRACLNGLVTGIARESWGSDGASGKTATGISISLLSAGYPFVAQGYASLRVKRAGWGPLAVWLSELCVCFTSFPVVFTACILGFRTAYLPGQQTALASPRACSALPLLAVCPWGRTA